MPNLTQSVSNIIARFGQPCTITWKQVGSGSSALPAQSMASSVKIGSRSFYNAAGSLQTIITGMLPPTDRNLQGATIAVKGKTYTVVGNIETIYQGNVVFQKVTLGA